MGIPRCHAGGRNDRKLSVELGIGIGCNYIYTFEILFNTIGSIVPRCGKDLSVLKQASIDGYISLLGVFGSTITDP